LEQIGYVRAIVEGYDGVASVHAPDGNRGEVEWLVGEGMDDEAAVLAQRLAKEAGLIAIARPKDWPGAK
jgi:hypothetical protein